MDLSRGCVWVGGVQTSGDGEASLGEWAEGEEREAFI